MKKVSTPVGAPTGSPLSAQPAWGALDGSR